MAHEYRPAPMSLAQRAALRSQAPRTLRQPARRRIYPLVILLVLLVVVVVAVGGFEYYYRDRVYPKVHLNTLDVNLAGMTQSAVSAEVAPFSVRQRLRVIDLIAPGNAPIFVNAMRLGYRVDRGLTAWHAYSIGRTGDLLTRAKSQANVLIHGADVDIVQNVDGVALRNYLFRLAPLVNRRPRPGRAGRVLDVAPAQAQLSYDLRHVVGGFKYYLPFKATPALPVPKKHTRPQHKHNPRKHSSRKH